MIDIEVHAVDPNDLFADADAYPASVFLCRFDLPLTPLELADMSRRLSSTGAPVDPRDIRSVRYDADAAPTSTAMSLDRLDPHTDGSFLEAPPHRFILSCTTTDAQGGGATTLIPIDFIVDSAPSWALAGLTSGRFLFLKTYDGNLTDSCVASVLTRADDGRPRIRWRADSIYRPKVVEDNGTRADEAAQWLHSLLTTCGPFRHVLQPGELLVIPNDMFVHGRDPLSPGSRREVLRSWVF